MSQAEWLAAEFDRCWPWLEKALVAGFPLPSHSKADVWAVIEHGEAMLWPFPNGAVVASIKVTPTGVKYLCIWIAGGDLGELTKAERALADWATKAGCEWMEITGRRGWLRALEGYQEVATVMVRELP